MSNTFLLGWDMTGLETCINVSAIEKEKVWDLLIEKNSNRPNINQIVQHMMLRARYNSQRHYEIYTMQVDEGIDEADIREMFDADPQYSADLIRDRGNKIYSDRVNKKEVKIT